MVSKNVLGQAVIFLTARHQTPDHVSVPYPVPVPGFETVLEGLLKGLERVSKPFPKKKKIST